MAADPLALPARIARAAAVGEIRAALKVRSVRRVARALRSLVLPAHWPAPAAARLAALDRAVIAGDPEAVRIRAADAGPAAPGSSRAIGRARALEALAATLSPPDAAIERRVAAYLRGASTRAIQPPAPDPARAATAAHDAAERLQAAGHGRPLIVITLPGFVHNPYNALLETAYARHGCAAVHVEDLDEAAAIVGGRAAGRFDAILHVNASNRVVAGARDGADATARAAAALARIDGWLDDGVPLVVSIHDGAILSGARAEAERTLAQGIADRAAVVHVLTASTPRILEGWLTLDPAKVVHVPHPNYDGAYATGPDREAAREALGIDPRDPASDGRDLLLGVIGTLRGRKGVLALLDALDALPEPVGDGPRLRLLLAGTPGGPDAETLIRRAYASARVIPRLEFVPDNELPGLLAAIDVAVVPYERYLNSGWLVLALGAGIPVIAPADGTAAEIARPAALRTFSHAEPGSLAQALGSAGELATPAARLAARASVADLVPDVVSDRFVRTVLLPARIVAA